MSETVDLTTGEIVASVGNQAELRDIPLDELDPHPNNPRIVIREDVVDDIARELRRTGYGREHAILVCPTNGRHRILSGHHRVEAARRAHLVAIPAWVRDMDEDEQFFTLVLANAERELAPLEVGMHVLDYTTPSLGGRGKRGGVAEYAGRLGKDDGARAYLTKLRAAAGVAKTCSPGNMFPLLDKAPHLYEISRASQSLWPLLIDHMLRDKWNKTDARTHVDRINSFDIPEDYAWWLPLAEVVERHLSTKEFSPRTVVRLVSAADEIYDWIDANRPAVRDDFTAWLLDNKGGESWKPRSLRQYLQRLIAVQLVILSWHHGDWREHVDQLDDGSVGLLLTDPPYGQGFQSDYRLDRRKPLKHQPIANDDVIATVELQEALEALAPKLTDDAHVLVFCGWANEPDMRDVVAKAGLTLRGSLIWDKQATGMGDPDTTFAPAHERILHAVKGSPTLYQRPADLLRQQRCNSSRHPTEKPVPLLRTLIEATTAEGQIVADPFGGVASVPVAAKESGRRWWGCELEERYHQIGEERLA